MADPVNVKEAIEQLGKTIEEFKAKHAQEISELKAKGTADATLREQVDRINAEVGRLDEIRERLAAVETKANRPGATANEQESAAAEAKAYAKEFYSWVRKGNEGSLREKAINVTTDADGGFAIAEELDKTIGKLETATVVMRSLASVIPVGNETYERLFATGAAANGWVDEDDARPETDTPTLVSAKPLFGEVYANPGATQKSLDDVFFNVEAWLAEEIARGFALSEGDSFLNGNGTKKPKGILAYTFAATADGARAFGQYEKVTTAAASKLDADDLLNVVEAINAGYEGNARWLLNRKTLFAIRKLKNAETGEYVWRASMEAGTPSTIWGFPYSIDAYMPAIADTKIPVLFGDFRRGYVIADVRGVRMLRDPYTAKPKVLFYTTKRVGGGAMDTQAIKGLEIKAA